MPGQPAGQQHSATLFDCVLDNLIDNVLKKRQIEPGIAIEVELQVAPLRLIVCDSGAPIPEQLVANLLHNVVVSENGLGIGLYQAARWADSWVTGWRWAATGRAGVFRIMQE